MVCRQVQYLVLFCTFFKLFSVISCENVTIIIPLNKTITVYNRELYGGFFSINNASTIQFKLENSNKALTFVIFQAHSHNYNITMEYNSSHIAGTNVGLYGSVKPSLGMFYITNNNEIDLKIYISVQGYRVTDPIPGGANMEFPVYISPFMLLDYNKDYIDVKAQPPSLQDKITKTTLKFYMMYILEWKFDPDSYFDAIRNFTTLDNVLENGVEIPVVVSRPLYDMRRYVAAYPGFGSVYVAVATKDTDPTAYSVYVPIFTYACSPLIEGDCEELQDVTSQILCATVMFLGIFVCYYGHRFFKTEMFVMGMFAGLIITYIVNSLISDMDHASLLGVSVLSGLFCGAIWLIFWWIFGAPILAVMLATLHLGFLFAAIIYYRMPAGNIIVETNATFWPFFILLMCVTAFVLVSTTLMSNILCCAILGAYATVFSIDYFVGSNLKYIIVNIVRRAVVEKFNYASVMPPFQLREISLTVLWVVLAVSGVLVQSYHSLGRYPFPPPPRSMMLSRPVGGTRLLGEYGRNRYGAVGDEDEPITRERPNNRVGPNSRVGPNELPSTSVPRIISYTEGTPLLFK